MHLSSLPAPDSRSTPRLDGRTPRTAERTARRGRSGPVRPTSARPTLSTRGQPTGDGHGGSIVVLDGIATDRMGAGQPGCSGCDPFRCYPARAGATFRRCPVNSSIPVLSRTRGRRPREGGQRRRPGLQPVHPALTMWHPSSGGSDPTPGLPEACPAAGATRDPACAQHPRSTTPLGGARDRSSARAPTRALPGVAGPAGAIRRTRRHHRLRPDPPLTHYPTIHRPCGLADRSVEASGRSGRGKIQRARC
jgi:hypothetical protein